ncbi:MAG TPA: glutaredoxin 3 [Polyangia bacterium]|nr:glutaredoxin 3 [Polyangia bacterium]
MVDVRIYTTSWCPYCHSAKALLKKRGVAFEEIDASDPEQRRWLVEKTGLRTVPQIFIAGVPVGGSDELHALDRAGELVPILAGERPPPSVI